jgi:hypothetical protein
MYPCSLSLLFSTNKILLTSAAGVCLYFHSQSRSKNPQQLKFVCIICVSKEYLRAVANCSKRGIRILSTGSERISCATFSKSLTCYPTVKWGGWANYLTYEMNRLYTINIYNIYTNSLKII